MKRASIIHIMRMFARMVGRVPTSHLWYLLRRMRFEKPHRFDGRVRVNTFFPPYPSPAFDRFCEAVIARRRVPFSTYLAVTGECPCTCGHCSYAGRSGGQLAHRQLLAAVEQIKALGTCTLGLTGGEPLLYDRIDELVAAAGPEMATVLFTTGHSLDAARARKLAQADVTCVTIGLEAVDPDAHDRIRKRAGSFAEAQAAAAACREAGIYLAVSTIGTRGRIADGTLARMYELAARWGAGEFRVLAPIATGGWVGRADAVLGPDDRKALMDFHVARNRDGDGPAVASFPYLESEALFGCGAGYHHLFIDAAGQVCPCDLTPLSFGDLTQEPLADIWQRMAKHFPLPRCHCLMGEIPPDVLADADVLPLSRERSEAICPMRRAEDPLPQGYRRLMKP